MKVIAKHVAYKKIILTPLVLIFTSGIQTQACSVKNISNAEYLEDNPIVVEAKIVSSKKVSLPYDISSNLYTSGEEYRIEIIDDISNSNIPTSSNLRSQGYRFSLGSYPGNPEYYCTAVFAQKFDVGETYLVLANEYESSTNTIITSSKSIKKEFGSGVLTPENYNELKENFRQKYNNNIVNRNLKNATWFLLLIAVFTTIYTLMKLNKNTKSNNYKD